MRAGVCVCMCVCVCVCERVYVYKDVKNVTFQINRTHIIKK